MFYVNTNSLGYLQEEMITILVQERKMMIIIQKLSSSLLLYVEWLYYLSFVLSSSWEREWRGGQSISHRVRWIFSLLILVSLFIFNVNYICHPLWFMKISYWRRDQHCWVPAIWFWQNKRCYQWFCWSQQAGGRGFRSCLSRKSWIWSSTAIYKKKRCKILMN